MTSNAPKFRLLHLPRLALEHVLRNFNDGNLVMFSLCSKRCNLVVKSFRHGFTGIQVTLSRDTLALSLRVQDIQQMGFEISKEVFQLNDYRVLILDERAFWMGEGNPNTRSIFTYWNWALDVKALVDHMVETFRVPFETVKFLLDYFDHYRDFVQCFPKCENLRIWGVGPISEEDIAYFKKHVEHKHFYINGNLQ
ncbi:hypothetical protein GCK72_004628 [Caenorhabditis remanei]|uniref:F-box domain-containing protein n=1 Tax=Caenorhabditis remanei TaxID=31234 RepID=A0A6A5HCB6_CAERE|nr:hypothetical protein GCK72_004628 [Caenorhabditis remanei]KAF1764679.1 hypothetical protein GCK72_004628 [Caenorhabditis remanei]